MENRLLKVQVMINYTIHHQQVTKQLLKILRWYEFI